MPRYIDPHARRRLGRSDVMVSPLCLGTMMYGEQIDEAAAFAQMDRCLDAGINFFDTAELYTIPPRPTTQGDSERIVGRFMAERANRDRIVLATKIAGRSSLTYLRGGAVPRVTPAQIQAALDASLLRLQTDYVDLYQIHWPDRRVGMFGSELRGFEHHEEDDAVPIETQLMALDELVRAGKIRMIGLSNETAWGTMEFVATAARLGLSRIVSIQNAYNLVNRTFEFGLAEIAMREQVGLLAYSPIAQGVLSGKYLDGANPEGSRGALFGRLDRYQSPSGPAAIARYVGLARTLGVDPATLALQFVTTRPFVTSNIFGASSPEQLSVALASVNMPWTDEIERAIGDIHASIPNPCP